MNTGLLGLLNSEYNVLNFASNIFELGLYSQVIIMFALFLFLENKLFSLSKIKTDLYSSNVIFIKGLREMPQSKFYILIFIILILLSPFSSWDDITNAHFIRFFFSSLSLLIGITYSTYKFNYYFNQSHIIDRGLLLTFSILVYFHPIFILLTLYMSCLIIGQFFMPFYNSWTDKMLTFQLFILAIPFVILNGFGINISSSALMLTMFFVWAYIYFITGKGKYAMKWHLYNKLENLVTATKHQNNWWVLKNEKLFKLFIKSIKLLNKPFAYIVLGLELGVLLMLIHPYVSLFFIIGLTVFHIMVFFMSGIFFWKNILINICLIVFILFIPEHLEVQLFGIIPVIMTIIFVYLLLRSSNIAPELYWYDSPMSVKYVFTAETSTGELYTLNSSAMAPYDINFAQGRFYECFTTDKIVGCFGLVNSKSILDKLNNLNGEDLKQFINTRKKVSLANNQKSNELISFLEKYLQYARKGEKLKIFNYIHLPQHIWTQTKNNAYNLKKPISYIHISTSEQVNGVEIFNKKILSLNMDKENNVKLNLC